VRELRQNPRPGGGNNLDLETREEILVRASLGENQGNLAHEFGICQQTVSNIKTLKAVSAVDLPKVQDRIREMSYDVQDKALNRLLFSLGLLSDEKLASCSAKDLSSIGANLSRITEKILGDNRTNGPEVNITIYTPELRKEECYKTIEIG
jgi:hypothetical protein